MAVNIKHTVARVKREVVLGLDPSTKTGLVALDANTGELVEALNLKQPDSRTRNRIKQKRDPYDRLDASMLGLREVLAKYHVLGVCIEKYAFNLHGEIRQSVDSVIVQCRYGEAIRHILFNAGLDFIEVTPPQVKQFCFDAGKGGKDEIRLGVYKKWGVEFKTDDECDAFVLAKMALGIHRPQSVSLQYEKKVLDRVLSADYNQEPKVIFD